ncbi:MAG: TraI/MobA(P) family conjugative relaxase [Candidatus Competibacter sp.]|nr:TraI/MobA(P) family conjugative relaxase [Candidatus Competibacter sp.]
MIAKHVPMKSVRKSDFAGLVKYLIDEQQKRERVTGVSVTNCHAERPDAAILEVLNTQAQNRRAESDKTYHLIVSFRAGEQPDAATLQAIERRICDGLGYGEHQRVSTVHHDTDNLHLHIAINKIHPTRYTIHDPYRDHKTLGELCEKLEGEYGLQRDNHQAQKRGAENRADDMERHAGIESLLGWIQRECLEQIHGARSWAEMQQVLRDNGLEIREWGNGLVISDAAGTMVKASSVARELSRAKLEARLGRFEPSPERLATQADQPTRQYEPRPVRTRADTVELYARYRAEQQGHGAARTVQWTQARDRKSRLIEAAKRSGRLKRAAIKLMGSPALSRKALYTLTSRTLKDEINKINQQYRKERQAIHEKCRRQAWADWLRRQATEGDSEALAALRARGAALGGLQGNTVTGNGGQQSGQGVEAQQDGVTKKGTLIYRVGASAIRDDGDKLQVSRGATQDGLEAALRMAMARYGNRITVKGSAEFKESIAHTAATADLAITFDDAALEQRRQTLLNEFTTKENRHDASARTDRGRTDQSRTSRSGSNATHPTGAGRRVGSAAATGITRKPNVGRVGRQPPPEAQNRLRSLSQLGLVRIASGSEVLLPGHVPDHLEHPGAQPDDGLRRGLARPGVAAVVGRAGLAPASSALEAVDKYIAEREEKRLKIFDIPKHRRYNEDDSGAAIYAGSRQIDGHSLALLKRGEEVIVLPIDEASARRMKRLALGDPVTVTKGSIKMPGRSR